MNPLSVVNDVSSINNLVYLLKHDGSKIKNFFYVVILLFMK